MNNVQIIKQYISDYDKPVKMMEEVNDDLNFSCWLVEDKTKFKPLADSSIKKHITPNIYEVKMDRSSGEIYFEVIDNVSDGLIRFENNVIDKVLNDVDNFWKHKDEFKKFGMLHKRGILLSGAPGTGKSCTITLISKYIIEHNGIVINVTPRSFGDAVTLLTAAFRKIEKDMPVVVIMEDIDQYPCDMTPYLLDFLDGKKSIENIMVVMTSNDTTNLSNAILRPGRVDKQYVVPKLTDADRTLYFKSKGFEGEELDNLVKLSNDLNISQCKELISSYAILGEPAEDIVNYLKKPIEKVNYLELDYEQNNMQM